MSFGKLPKKKYILIAGVALAIALLVLLALYGDNAELLKHLIAEDFTREELRALVDSMYE